MKQTVINADGLILGRMAVYAAKRALLGDKVDIVNCEKAVISGSRDNVFARYERKYKMGAPLIGPYVHRAADRLVRRTIRGMLPYKKAKGKEAFDRVMCHKGVPDEFKEKMITVQGAELTKLPNLKYVRLGEISKLLGAR